MSDKQFTAIVHHVCSICAKRDDGELLIHKRFGDLSNVHNQNVGWKICDECKHAIEVQNAVMLIVVDPKRTSDLNDMNTWYRCGIILGVTHDYIRRLFTPAEHAEAVIKKGAAVLELEAAEKLGFDVSTYRKHEKELSTSKKKKV